MYMSSPWWAGHLPRWKPDYWTTTGRVIDERGYCPSRERNDDQSPFSFRGCPPLSEEWLHLTMGGNVRLLSQRQCRMFSPSLFPGSNSVFSFDFHF